MTGTSAPEEPEAVVRLAAALRETDLPIARMFAPLRQQMGLPATLDAPAARHQACSGEPEADDAG
jgi:hypothetical protein